MKFVFSFLPFLVCGIFLSLSTRSLLSAFFCFLFFFFICYFAWKLNSDIRTFPMFRRVGGNYTGLGFRGESSWSSLVFFFLSGFSAQIKMFIFYLMATKETRIQPMEGRRRKPQAIFTRLCPVIALFGHTCITKGKKEMTRHPPPTHTDTREYREKIGRQRK